MNALFEEGSGWGNYAIQGIVEIQLPEAVSLWPQTPGWWVLLVVLLSWLLSRLLQSLQRYWRNRYRRMAIAQLLLIQQQVSAGNNAVLRQVPELIKATALQAYPRHQIANLYGHSWEAFLDSSYPGPSFKEHFPGQLYAMSYDSPDLLPRPVNDQWWSQLQLWILTHQGEELDRGVYG